MLRKVTKKKKNEFVFEKSLKIFVLNLKNIAVRAQAS